MAVAAATTNNTATSVAQTTPIVRLKPASLPKLHGCKRSFYRWMKDWESLQKQGEPTKMQLLDSVDERISKNLRLTMCNCAEDMFRVLENGFGNKSTIALEITEELQKIPVLRASTKKGN